jgi:uncharacterized protein YdhG (YjbR/CyaY superfamily)
MAAATTKATGFSAAERKAMKDRAEELELEGRGGKKKAQAAQACLDKIAEMPDADRVIAERIHAIVATVAPELEPKTMYGMPAYAKDGKVVCFFQAASKFDTRYCTLGFEDLANLDAGTMWPTTYAIAELNETNVKKIEKLVEQAVS